MLFVQNAAKLRAGCSITSDPTLSLKNSRDQTFTTGAILSSDNWESFIPHTDKGDMDKIWECTMCHTPHAMPPKKAPNREPANVEACYQCHHQYNFKRCDECHGGNK